MNNIVFVSVVSVFLSGMEILHSLICCLMTLLVSASDVEGTCCTQDLFIYANLGNSFISKATHYWETGSARPRLWALLRGPMVKCLCWSQDLNWLPSNHGYRAKRHQNQMESVSICEYVCVRSAEQEHFFNLWFCSLYDKTFNWKILL